KLVKDLPGSAPHAVDLGIILKIYGYVVDVRGRQAEAVGLLAQAIQALSPYARGGRPLPSAREPLRTCYLNRSEVLMKLESFAEAIDDIDRGLELDPQTNRVACCMVRARCRARVDPARAVAEAEDLVRTTPGSSQVLVNAAHVLSLSSVQETDALKREAYAARAVALLRQAREKGDIPEKPFVSHLKEDRELLPLRSRTDFKAFLKELKTKG